MSLKVATNLAVAALLLACFTFFAGCGGGSGIRVTEASGPFGEAEVSDITQPSDATIVHVNVRERLATIRKGNLYTENAFLKTVSRQGEETGILKTRAQRPSGLRTADIVEGSPNINDRTVPVSDAERARLEELYRDSADGTL